MCRSLPKKVWLTTQQVKKLTTGCSVRVMGELVASPAKGQAVEVRAQSVEVLGWADGESYPLQKKRHSFEFLRSMAHLRPRTNALGAVARVRSSLSFAIHRFFHEQGFVQVHTPVNLPLRALAACACCGAVEQQPAVGQPTRSGHRKTPGA